MLDFRNYKFYENDVREEKFRSSDLIPDICTIRNEIKKRFVKSCEN